MLSAAAGPAQDMSYEALTNLEDVKLTAPPELLATMPLDMCLKGSQWEDKVRKHALMAFASVTYTLPDQNRCVHICSACLKF